jgi:hypothetical protein
MATLGTLWDVQTMIYRRSFAGLVLLLLALGWWLLPEPVQSAGMYGLQIYHHYAFRDTATGYHYTDATNGKILAYEADLSDTTGAGTLGTYFETAGGDTGWYWGNLATNSYDFVHHNDTDTTMVAESVPVWGRTVGDSTITDSIQFKADVVGTHAIRDWAVVTAHLDADAVTASKLATAAVDSDAVGTAEINPIHMVTTADYTFGQVDADSGLVVGESIDWTSGNVTFVPLDGDIQTYVTAASAGETLVLASGLYTITSTITIAKQLNIVGQGHAGFATTPVTPSHGTIISSTTASVVAFQIDNDNVRLSDLSINLTGAGSKAINTAADLQGLVFSNLDIIVNCSGAASAFTIKSSDVVMRDVSFYVTSSDNTATGVYFWNDSGSAINATADCWNVTGTAVGGATYAYAFACYNNNDANTLTLNLSNSVCVALTGTALDIACAATSTTTFNSTINAYHCTFDGADYDAYQTGSNVLNLGGSVLVNNLISGTVTYRATMASGALTIGGVQWDDGAGKVREPAIATTMTRDSEWDTAAEINAATTDSDFLLEDGYGATQIFVTDGTGSVVAVSQTGDGSFSQGGVFAITTNTVSAEDLNSADNPTTGDYPSWNTSDTFTWQNAEERNIHVLSDVDTSMTFETTDPGASASWLVYKAGVLVGDVAWLEAIGTPPYYDNLGEKYTYSYGCTCRAADTLDCFKSPATAKSGGSARLAGFIERWPWNGPGDPK